MDSTTSGVDVATEVNGKNKGGILLIKPEYVISDRETAAVQAEKIENQNGEKPAENEDNQPPQKKARWNKEQKKNRKGSAHEFLETVYGQHLLQRRPDNSRVSVTQRGRTRVADWLAARATPLCHSGQPLIYASDVDTAVRNLFALVIGL